MAKEDAQNSEAVQVKAKPRGRPFTGADDPRRNNGGVPREARELRDLLKGEAEEIHGQLAALRRAGNVAAILYSHRQLVGDPPGPLETGPRPHVPLDAGWDLSKLSDEDFATVFTILKKTLAEGEIVDAPMVESADVTAKRAIRTLQRLAEAGAVPVGVAALLQAAGLNEKASDPTPGST